MGEEIRILSSNGSEIGLTNSDALSKILLFSASASKAPLSVVCPIVQDASVSLKETVSDQEETEVVSTPVAAMWSHQDEAIEWFLDPEQANGVGIFQMATGSGKTRTAINSIRRAVKEEKVDKTVICIPKTLENQWENEILQHYPECDLGVYWMKAGEKKHRSFFRDNEKHGVLLVSFHFVPKLLDFARTHKDRIGNTMLVVDEMHHLGSASFRRNLEQLGLAEDADLNDDQVLIQSLQSDDFHPFPMRLGLSATPWNPYDDARNEYVAHGFVNGEVDFGVEHWEGHLIENNMVFHFGLKDGIERGILCPFDYHPLDYTPSKSDFEERAAAFRKIPRDIPQHLRTIYGRIQSAKVFKKSKEKFNPFKDWLVRRIRDGKPLERCIMFVADRDFGSNLDTILSSEFHITDFHTYFQGEQMDTLKRFATGASLQTPHGLNSLIACERISEGIDIKSVDTIVLFSSDQRRLKTIQRIGRALRTDPARPSKVATVVDFIYDDPEHSDIARRDWLHDLSKARRDLDD